MKSFIKKIQRGGCAVQHSRRQLRGPSSASATSCARARRAEARLRQWGERQGGPYQRGHRIARLQQPTGRPKHPAHTRGTRGSAIARLNRWLERSLQPRRWGRGGAHAPKPDPPSRRGCICTRWAPTLPEGRLLRSRAYTYTDKFGGVPILYLRLS